MKVAIPRSRAGDRLRAKADSAASRSRRMQARADGKREEIRHYIKSLERQLELRSERRRKRTFEQPFKFLKEQNKTVALSDRLSTLRRYTALETALWKRTELRDWYARGAPDRIVPSGKSRPSSAAMGGYLKAASEPDLRVEALRRSRRPASAPRPPKFGRKRVLTPLTDAHWSDWRGQRENMRVKQHNVFAPPLPRPFAMEVDSALSFEKMRSVKATVDGRLAAAVDESKVARTVAAKRAKSMARSRLHLA
eukprot:PLAT4476.1.p1 GENE.PLAT4476.1~~PLAT4476.1.p1  ORF type:complete len:252 (+),score=17.25 PLAT4476.1:64-819(+)